MEKVTLWKPNNILTTHLVFWFNNMNIRFENENLEPWVLTMKAEVKCLANQGMKAQYIVLKFESNS